MCCNIHITTKTQRNRPCKLPGMAYPLKLKGGVFPFCMQTKIKLRAAIRLCVLTVCVSHVFVYDVVNVNKIVIVSSTKPPSYPYAQVSTGLILYLG